MRRREFFTRATGAMAVGVCGSLLAGSPDVLASALDTANADVAKDELFWRKIRALYVPPTEFVDLDHANTSPTSTRVFEAFASHSKKLSRAPAEQFGKMWEATEKDRLELAKLLGTQTERMALTPNATFALNTVLRGLPLNAGDEILVTDHEYPDMIETILQRSKREGIVMRKVLVDPSDRDGLGLVDRIKAAISPRTKLILISHVSAWSGEILPVGPVSEAARRAGVPVLVDAAQSVGMLDVNFDQIGCDFLATSLHKWLGAPISTGVLVMRKEHVGKVWPLHPPSWDTTQYPMDQYEWTGTFNMAANVSIGDAITFHRSLGPARKLDRMRYLGEYWQNKLRDVPEVQILTPQRSERSFGVAAFAVKDLPPFGLTRYQRDVKGFLVQDKSGRHSPFAKALRVSPAPYTNIAQLDRFVAAVKDVVRAGLPAKYSADRPT